MRFSKQKKSLDRDFFPLRKKFSILNKIYNSCSQINVNNSLKSKIRKKSLSEQASISFSALLKPAKETSASNTIPKIIWMFWDSGFEDAPEVVRLSVESWKEMNPDYEVKLLNNKNLEEYLGFDFHVMYQKASVRCLPPTKADLLRLHLLSKHGGVWTDATTFCLQPLSKWLPEATKECHLFTFKHRINPTRPIEAWFIASPKGSKVINETLTGYANYIFSERRLSLFISGKVSLLEKVIKPEEKTRPLEPEVSLRAEKLGFMPYFSIGYFFYKALKNNLSEESLKIFLRLDDAQSMTNKHALTKDDFAIFENAVVSKQTYIQSYVKSDMFKKRKEKLMNRIKTIIS